VHGSFELLREDEVREYNTKFTLYRHIKTGAEVMSVVNDDDNKVFGIAFRTPADDSTGVPHILEHSVLCGSDKYPVKEPFVHLLRSSMKTYLNAYTYPERTIYPVASQNLKDFYNLANVYLDAVLHPRAMKDEMVLQQEGWHYEIAKPEDPLTYKGIVFNEMKGVFGSPDSRLHQAGQHYLFPNTTYQYISGGDPAEIPSLTFAKFKAFYEKHYHPSNSRVYFYGNDPIDARLALLDSYFAKYDKEAVDSTRVETQRKWDKPRRVTESYPVAPDQKADDNRHALTVHWLLNEEAMSPSDQFDMGVLNHLLMGTTSATLYKAMTNSALGDSITGYGFSDSLKQATFAVGLKGVAPENVSKVESLIDETLADVVKTGFSEEAVEASLNTIEFNKRSFSSSSTGRGIAFMNAAMKHWVFERDPLRDLRFEAPLADLKVRLGKKDQTVFQDLVRNYIVENKHRLTVEGVPDPTLGAKEEATEKSKLELARSKLDTNGLSKLVDNAKQLKAAQEAPDTKEQIATLPTLSLADLDRKAKDIDIKVGELHGAEFLTHEVASDGIVYVDVALDASSLPIDDVPLVPLFTALLFDTGTSKLSRTEFDNKIGAETGGLSASAMNALKFTSDGAVGNPDDIVYRVVVHGKATANQTTAMLSLMRDAMFDAKLDSQSRAIELLKSSKASMEGGFRSSGTLYATTHIFARRSLSGYIDEISGGITYYQTLKEYLKTAESDWPSLLTRLERMRTVLLDRESAVINLAADAKTLKVASGPLDAFVKSLPTKGSGLAVNLVANSKALDHAGKTVADAMHGHPELRVTPSEDGFVVPTQVNFVAKGGGLFAPGQKVTGANQVVVRYLSNSYMWDQVRVMGGAYGSSCSVSQLSGTFLCSSYRDPNLEGTLKTYDGVVSYLRGLTLDDKAVEQLIIGAVADLDQPIAPASQGLVSLSRHLTGATLSNRQRWRDEIFATTPKDFESFASTLEEKQSNFHACAFGSKEAITRANSVLPTNKQLSFSDLS